MQKLTTLAAFGLLAACSADVDNADTEADAFAENSVLEDSRSMSAIAGIEPDPGMRWFYESATQTAVYGPSNGEGIMTVSCNRNLADEEALVVQHMAEATNGARRSVTMHVGEASTSFDMEGQASALDQSAIWTGGIDTGSAAATMIADADGPIVFEFPSDTIAVPVSDELGNVLAACA